MRFSRKRISTWGAEADEILHRLEGVSLPMLRDHPDKQGELLALIDEGRRFREFLRGLVHRDFPLPPGADGSNYQVEAQHYTDLFLHWREQMGGLASAHLELLRRAEAEDRVKQEFLAGAGERDPEQRKKLEAFDQIAGLLRPGLKERYERVEPVDPKRPDQ